VALAPPGNSIDKMLNQFLDLFKTKRSVAAARSAEWPIHVISATRLDKDTFWADAALGRSLKYYLEKGNIQAFIHYSNTDGLSKIYNRYIEKANADVILVFVHDDIWLESMADVDWDDGVRAAMHAFDVAGVVGNVRLGATQPGWCFQSIVKNTLITDVGYLSGFLGHGAQSTAMKDDFGPSPMACQVLDGVFLAMQSSKIKVSSARFDERFTFDFYDMDFCRSAVQNGLKLGTWPISLTHQGNTNGYGSPAWTSAYAAYLEKWNPGHSV
jgi:GT2 family glycosyltransferase